MDKVHLLESSWSWFGSAEERVSGEIFKWKNLASFKNWVDQGTAFANPDYRANWSGLLNDDKGRGVVRVSDNAKTPGLKLWTFGPQSLSININDSSASGSAPPSRCGMASRRSSGMRGTMAANEVRQWNQSFFPILGLTGVTAASENGALQLSSAKSGSNTVLNVAATLTLPNQTVKAVLRAQRHHRRRARRGDCRRGANHRERERGEQPGSRRRRLRGRFPAGRPKPAGWTDDPAVAARVAFLATYRNISAP